MVFIPFSAPPLPSPLPPGSGTPMQAMSGTMWMPTAPPDLTRLIAVHLQPVPVVPAIALMMLISYLVAVLALRRRGDRWPAARLIWWSAGVLTILAVTATGFEGYGMELFSIHMVQHMVLSMLAPVFLTLGAPITLALRALPARPRRVLSARRLLLLVLHSPVARFLTHPIVTIALFLLSLYGVYFTTLFDILMSTMWGHNLMLLHFLAIGMLYFWGVMGVDPSPRQKGRTPRVLQGPVLRIFELFATVPFHAFFGVVIMMSVGLVVRYYAVPIPGWPTAPLHDQAVGGGIAWSFTEIPTLLVLGVLFIRWQRSEAKSERRLDRRIRIQGDVERGSYNDYLAALAERDRRATP